MLESLAHFDPEVVLGKALSAAAPKLASAAGRLAKTRADRLKASFHIGYKSHVQATFDRCYRIKTLIYRDQPVELLTQYVSVGLKIGRTSLADTALIEDLESFRSIILIGTAGSGKTMLMKYLALCRFENPKGRIPLFVEMRNLEYDSGKPLVDLIYREVTAKRSKIDVEQFKIGLEEGIFLIILDGLDEIDPAFRPSIHKELIRFPIDYPDNIVVISSREDDELAGWTSYSAFKVLPFKKSQITKVIQNIDFDKNIKAKFLRELRTGLYEKHKDFLQNPLLATIMFLRFDQFASVYNKIYIFYEQAFDTLFFKHDIGKGVYERKRYTDITLDDFKRFFSAFCFASYKRNEVSFLRSDLITAIQKAINYCGLQAKPELVVKDLVESICILQEDGIYYTFIHRSFQEYFSALFVRNYRGEKLPAYVKAMMERPQSENAGRLLYEMARDIVEENWILPKLKEINKVISRTDPEDDPASFVNALHSKIYMSRDGALQGFGFTPAGNNLFNVTKYVDIPDASGVFLFRFFRNNSHDHQLRKIYERAFGSGAAKGLGNDSISLELCAEDNVWLRETGIAFSVARAREGILRTLKATEARVQERKDADDIYL